MQIIIYIHKWLTRVGHAPASGRRSCHLGGIYDPRTELMPSYEAFFNVPCHPRHSGKAKARVPKKPMK